MRSSNPRMALLWTQKELEVEQYCIGEDHPDYQKGLEVVRCLQSAEKSREPLDKRVIEWFKQEEPPVNCALM